MRNYVWIAVTENHETGLGQVHAVAERREQLADIAGMTIEGPVPADVYPIGRVFRLDGEDL